MNTRFLMFCPALAFVVFGCAGSLRESDSESRAEEHMRMADSLQTELALRAATLEYGIVAELYPQSSSYPIAVRNVAMLYSNPLNPAMDDSLSLSWFEKYLSLTLPREERTRTEIYVTMLRRISQLRAEISRKTAISDSLQTANRKQAGELAARAKRVAEVESELHRTTDELRRVREVDIRINRRKEK